MSKRSKRKHRQQREANQEPSVGHGVARGEQCGGGGRVRAVWIGGAVVAAGAILYAVTGGSERKEEMAAGSVMSPGVAGSSATAPALLSAAAGEAAAASIAGPKIVFATPVYDFGQIKGGEAVKYTYVFTNAGGAMLQVSNVQASCGCTTAGDWTRQVEPGKTGSIPIQFNSGSFSGAVGKSITVSCNDTNQPTVVLQIKGTIWKPVDVLPQFAVINVTTESPSNATTVRIVNNEEAPLALGAAESSNPAFAAELRTNQPGKEFQLLVKTVGPLAGSVQGQITLKTSSTNLPVISVNAWANVQAAVTVTPAQITLPASPLANVVSSMIMIRNNGTNALSLSEPGVNIKEVDVQLKEVEAGRFFALTANFPAGFEMAQGEKVEVSVKTSHAQFPVIKVPVIQAGRPAPPAGMAAAGSAASK